MSLTGSFSTMPLPDLLQWIGDTRRSGQLSVSLDFEERFLVFRDGSVVGLASDDPRLGDLGALLLARGLVVEAALPDLLAQATAAERPLSDVAVDKGLVPRARMDELLVEHTTSILLDMFLWRDGRFHFSLGSADGVEAAPLGGLGVEVTLARPIDTREILMEGMRRLDEWRRMAEVFPTEYAQVFALGTHPQLPLLDELLARGEPIGLGELCAGRAASRYAIYEQLYRAHREGLLAVDSKALPPEAEGERSPVDVLVRNGALLVEERQFDEAAALLRSALDLDPFRTEARELLQRAREQQLAELYQTFAPFKVPVLRLPRDKLLGLHLTPRERTIASRINGQWDVGALSVLTPVGELETLRALRKLVHIGAVALRD